MAIGILIHGLPEKRFCRLADRPIGDADWPLGEPEGAATLGDLTARDHLVLTLSSRSLLAVRAGLRCRVSALIFEPPAIQRRYYAALPYLGGWYHRVLTHNRRLLERLPNARYLPHGGQHVLAPPGDDTPKTERVSLIASAKRSAPGHRLRHRIAEWSRREAPDLALLGSGYQPLDDKAEGHTPYRYSVVIENSRDPGYFTEKLVDSLLCRSLPIYWGAPDIEHSFDPRGMIVCRTAEEVREAILRCDNEGFEARRPFLEENRRRALGYADRRRNAALLLEHEDQLQSGAARPSVERHAA